MQTISITVANKRATAEGSPVLVCNNTGDEIAFTFDDEWKDLDPKVARFVYTCDGQVLHQDVAFTGDTVEIPLLSNVNYVHVGVYAGELSTTTAAYIPCLPSVLCGSGAADSGVIFSPDYGKFKLWTDITLSEDTQLIRISKTDDGKPFKIKKLFLYFYGKFNSEAVLCLRYNDGQIYQSWKMVSASTKTDGFWILSEKIAPGLYLSKYPENVIQVGDDGAAQGLGQHIQSIKADFHYDAKGLVGTSIIFGAHGSYTDFRMLTGSRILVWGVQDDD